MNLILLGAPGAGKGTQAEIISEKYSIPAISTGNILREAIKNGTDFGLEAKAYMDRGDLVPDETIIRILKDRLAQDDCKNGFILDGVPRTINQAQEIENMGITIDKVIDIEVSDDEIIKRLGGRRVCNSCGSSYHILYNPPQKDDICTKCSGELIVRKDDHPDTIKDRLKQYHLQTEPLKAFYEQRGKLYIIPGQEELEQTTELTLKAVEAPII